jgi:hypothetical protein
MIGETRVLANCGYGTPICQTLNQAENELSHVLTAQPELNATAGSIITSMTPRRTFDNMYCRSVQVTWLAQARVISGLDHRF